MTFALRPYQANAVQNLRLGLGGGYTSLDEAAEAYLAAKRKLHEGCTI